MSWHRPRNPKNSRWKQNDPVVSERLRRMFGDEQESSVEPRPQQIDSVEDLLEPLTADDLAPSPQRAAKLPHSGRLFIPPPITGVTVGRRIIFHPSPSSRGTGAVAALSVSLFLLACAYAAFSGYMHSYDDGYAYIGIMGAIASLMAAGIGICLAADGAKNGYSGKLLSLCAIALAGIYGVLLFLAATGR